MNKANFYKSLRRRNSGVFGTSLSQAQVEGLEATLSECAAQGADLPQTAYILATAYGETGGKMQPQRENLRYSASRIPQVFSTSRRQGVPAHKLAYNPELLANTVYGGAWGAKNLGNTEAGDGWRFAGLGMGQITGRYNFTKWSKKMGLPLVSNPELLMQLDISVKALVQPMLEGWATGLSLGTFVGGGRKDYHNARKVWNGLFDAAKYAGYARAFEAALTAGGYSEAPAIKRPVQKPEPVVRPTAPAPNPFAALFAAIAALFKGKST